MAVLFPQHHKLNKGFTLIEILIAMAIIGVLIATIAFSITEMIRRGKVARAQGDIHRIVTAIRQLELDTGFVPGRENGDDCTAGGGGSNNEIYFAPGHDTLSNSGLYENFSTAAPDWKGPYLDGAEIDLNLDPWGNPYVYDGDYDCVEGVKGCERYISGATDDRVVTSYGEDRTQYTDDDIVYVFCGVGP